MMEHLKTQSTENVDTTLFLAISHNIEKRFKRVRIPFPAPKTKGKKDLLLTKPVNPSLSRASTMKSGSSFFVDLLG